MKKTLLVVIALLMTIATIATAIGFVSADEAPADIKYIEATLNEVVVDGVLSDTDQVQHTYEPDGKTFAVEGTASTAEYKMINKVGDAIVGGAWDQAKEKLYFGIKATDLVSAEIEIGGEAYEVDFVNGEVDGGEVFVSDEGDVAEIALPIEGLTLKHNGRYVYADLKLTITTSEGDNEFEGGFAFTYYIAGLVMNAVNQTAVGVLVASDAGTEFTDGFYHVTDMSAAPVGNGRKYVLPVNEKTVTDTKNVMWEMDLNVINLPAEVPAATGSAGQAITEAAGTCLWFHMKNTFEETIFVRMYNTADDGLVVVVYPKGGFVASPSVTIKLGKGLNELFRLGFEWHEDNSLNVYVDGKLVGTAEDALCIDSGLGKASGGIWFNTNHKKTFGVGENIDIMYGNISACKVDENYDEEALMELSAETVVIPTETTVETTTVTTPAASETTTVTTTKVTTTTAETTTVGTTAAATTAATTTEAEKGGCGSSLVAYGAVMVVGSALMAVVATSKKKED